MATINTHDTITTNNALNKLTFVYYTNTISINGAMWYDNGTTGSVCVDECNTTTPICGTISLPPPNDVDDFPFRGITAGINITLTLSDNDISIVCKYGIVFRHKIHYPTYTHITDPINMWYR
jgi:hypothetical protein